MDMPQFVGDDKLSIQRTESPASHNNDLALIPGRHTFNLWAERGFKKLNALLGSGRFLIVKRERLAVGIDSLEFLNKAFRSPQPLDE